MDELVRRRREGDVYLDPRTSSVDRGVLHSHPLVCAHAWLTYYLCLVLDFRSVCHSCAFLSHWTHLTLPEKTKQVSCSPITSRKSSPSWLLSGHLPHVRHGLLEIRPQELRKPSKNVSRKRKLVRIFSVLSCGTFCHEDSHSPSAYVGECTHAMEGIGSLPPSHFAMMSRLPTS